MKAFTVYLRGREIDRVFYGDSDPITSPEVRDSLVNHDGYHPAIVVTLDRPAPRKAAP